MTNYIATESPNRCSHMAISSKMLKFNPLGGFSNFQNRIFLSFVVLYQKNVFFELLFPPKIFLGQCQKYSQNAGLFSGRVKNAIIPPPENKKVRFR